MGVDFLRLHCVRGSIASVCRTVTALVEENGWTLLDSRTRAAAADFQKTVAVREENGWIVVDAGEGHFEPWAEKLAAELGTTGITMTSFSDEGAIEIARFDGKRCTQRTKKRGSDDELFAIAERDRLPRPLAAHEWPEGGRMLRFRHPPPKAIDRTPVDDAKKEKKKRRVSFEDTFHVRDVDRKMLEKALVSTLELHDFVPVPPKADAIEWAAGIVRVFVHEQRGVLSLGEHAIDDGSVVPAFKWGEILSRKLARDVLGIWHDGERAEATLWQRGREGSRSDIASFAGAAAAKTLDKSPLATFVRAIPLLALMGEVEGIELRFRRTGAVNHRPYQEEQKALDWASRAPNLARLNPAFSEYADLTPEQALRDARKPARRE